MENIDEKAFVNHLPDYGSIVDNLLDSSGECLSENDSAKLRSFADKMLNEVMAAYSNPSIVDGNDYSIYTGYSGVALLCLKLGNSQKALDLVQASLKHLRGRHKDCTFLCGDCGPLAVAALAYNRLGTQYITQRDQCIARIIQMEKEVCESSSLPNELLYGRAGYLYTLLLLQTELGETIISKQSIINVAQAIVMCGSQAAKNCRQNLPLLFTWHDKQYYGAAHGYAGIIYLLLKVVCKYPELNIDSLLIPTIDYLVGLQFPSGNFPSSFESGERDRLVHWCHGAPGFVNMLVAAYQKYKNENYKQAAMACGDVVWKRGLLRKGYGICHGVAGNAYTFLSLYKLSKDKKHLHRACQFALWCCDYGRHGCRTPDRPYSLFEGMAGTAYFLYDILCPAASKFPAFEV